MSEAYKLFKEDLQNNKAKDTQDIYEDRFQAFLKYIKVKSADVLIDSEKRKFEDLVHEFIRAKIKAGKSYTWLNQAVSAIRIFCISNRIDLNFTWLYSKIPKPEVTAEDGEDTPEEKPYSMEQIGTMLDLAIRQKKWRAVVTIFIMFTGGARIGALPKIDIERDLHYVEKYDLYAIMAYPKSKARYWIITSPQAKPFIDRVKGKRTTGRLFVSYLDGSAVTEDALIMEIWRLLIAAEIRTSNGKEKTKRHETKLDHGFRKTHSTVCESAGLTDQQIAHLRGKKDRLAKIYQIPPPLEVIENNNYMNAVPKLVVNIGTQ
jgi:hypothetical protein